MDVDFPRGHAPAGRHEKRKRTEDKLFKKTTVKRVKKKKAEDGDEDADVRVTISRITIATLPLSTVLIAAVHKITDFEILMIAPGGILVTVPIFNISQSYTEIVQQFMTTTGSSQPVKPQSMFTIGQCLPVKILEKEEPKSSGQMYKIIGSINPVDVHSNVLVTNMKSFADQVVLSAAVQSIEDNGVIMDLGLGKDMTGFLPDKPVQQIIHRLGLKKMPIGTVFLVAGVKLGKSERVLHLTACEKEMSSRCITGDEQLLAATTLLPGCRVSAVIMNVTDRGLVVVVGNEHNGYVHRDHLKSEWDLAKENYTIGDHITVTILFVHPLTGIVTCSLRGLTEAKSVMNKMSEYRMGRLIRKAVVVHVDDQNNVILKGKKNLKLVAAHNHLKDEYLEDVKIREEFPIGSQFDARILLISVFDSFIRVSLKPSLVSLDTADIDDVNIGSVMRGKVSKMTPRGLLLNLGYRLNVFVRMLHLSDSVSLAAKNPDKLFPLGKEVRVRILCIDRDTESEFANLLGTCKKSLIELPDHQVLDSLLKAVPDFVTRGVVVMSNASGVLLEFFNGLKGFIGRIFLQDYGNMEQDFPIGKLVTCKVINADLVTGKINLCLSSQDPQAILLQMRQEKKAAASALKQKVTTSVTTTSSAARTKGVKVNRVRSESSSTAGEDEPPPLLHTAFRPGCIVHARVGRLNQDGLSLNLLLLNPHHADLLDDVADHTATTDQHKLIPDGASESKGRESACGIWKESGISAITPYTHLTDAESVNRKHAASLYPSGSLVKCRIFKICRNLRDENLSSHSTPFITPSGESDQGSGVVVVATLKPSLLDERIPVWNNYSTLSPAARSIGVIRSTIAGGRLVEFVGGLTGRISGQEISQHYKILKQTSDEGEKGAKKNKKNKSSSKNLNNGQLIACRIISLIPEKMHINLSIVSMTETMAHLQNRDKKSAQDVLVQEKRQRYDSEASVISVASDLPIDPSADLVSSDSDDEGNDLEKGLSRGFTSPLIKDSNSRPSNPAFILDVNPDVRLIANLNDDDDEDWRRRKSECMSPHDSESEGYETGFNDDRGTNSDDMRAENGNKDSKKQKETSEDRSQRIRERSGKTRLMEQRLADRTREPESLEEHERAVASDPNSSYAWLQFMSFMLDQELTSGNVSLEQTRAIAEKALTSINFREDGERFNIWVALMNLEHVYGSEESLQDVIDRALSAMDQRNVYRHLAKMYAEAGKHDLAVREYEITLKKFKTVSFPFFLLLN